LLNIIDLAWKQAAQQIIFHKEDSHFSIRQVSRESGLACCHLPAEENQLR
jgi:hypothetical protein